MRSKNEDRLSLLLNWPKYHLILNSHYPSSWLLPPLLSVPLNPDLLEGKVGGRTFRETGEKSVTRPAGVDLNKRDHYVQI